MQRRLPRREHHHKLQTLTAPCEVESTSQSTERTSPDLEDDTTPKDACQTAAPANKKTDTVAPARKCQRPEAGGGGLGDGLGTSNIPEIQAGGSPPSDQDSTENPIWNLAMSFTGFQVRQGHNVHDDPKVAYALLNGTLLPQDAQELPKDLEASLASACQLHIQVPNRRPSSVYPLHFFLPFPRI